MSDASKRLDLRFGSFACSVQGFDDPVQPVQQVLRALQTLLEESPELSDAGISFDAEAIEQLTGEVARRADLAEEDVEITPGLIIVYRGARAAPAHALGAEENEDRGAAWAEPFAEGPAGRNGHDAPAGPEAADAPGDASPAGGYVNIFAPQHGGGTGASLFRGGTGPADGYPGEDKEDKEGDGHEPGIVTEDVFASRLGRLGATDEVMPDAYAAEPDAGSPADIFAAEDAAPDGGNIFAEPVAGAADDDLEEPLNLFSAVDEAPAEPEEAEEPEAETGHAPGRLFARFGARFRPEDSMGPPIAGEPEPEEPPAAVAEAEPFSAEKFAKAAAAETVEDLIVCAAAWMVLMKGQTRFARRDVLDVFDQLPGDHPKTLEAKIKGFGKAVRNGHVVMIQDGVFGLSRNDLEDFQRLL